MFKHESIETNSGMLIVLTLVAISIGGLVEIVPLHYINETVEDVKDPVTGLTWFVLTHHWNNVVVTFTSVKVATLATPR